MSKELINSHLENSLISIDDNQDSNSFRKSCFSSLSLQKKILIILGCVLIFSGIIVAIVFICTPKESSIDNISADPSYNLMKKSISNSETSLVDENLPKVSILEQGKINCKSTAVAQSVNIIVGSDTYTSASFGGDSCSNINGKKYKGSNGIEYVATYKTDSYEGSAKEQQDAIDASLEQGVPIVVAVHKKGSGTKHHWVTLLRKSDTSYDIIDPVKGQQKTLEDLDYDFGLADKEYASTHYGYVSFSGSQ